jgi:histone H3/H4
MSASPDAVLHLAALHTLASAGFASTSRAASLTLSGVLERYLQLVASKCAAHAALAGRSKVAAIDVVDALDGLGVGGLAELQEWTADLDKEVTFTGGRLDELAGGYGWKGEADR